MKSLTVLKKVCDFIAACPGYSSVFDVKSCSHPSDCIYRSMCVFVFGSTQVANIEFRMCFGSSAMDVFISLFSVSTSDGGQFFLCNSDFNWILFSSSSLLVYILMYL